MASKPAKQPVTTQPAALGDAAVEAARLDILKRELAVSRGLMVRARNGLEASRQATAMVRAEAESLRAEMAAAQKAAQEARQLMREVAREAARKARSEAAKVAADLRAESAGLREEIAGRDQTIGLLHHEIEKLRVERAMILGSFSWRVTRPMRFAVRKLRALRQRLRVSELRASFGRLGGRGAIQRSGLFDAAWYAQTYPDVAGAGADPLGHYMRAGWRENRHPGPDFDTAFYRHTHADIARAGLNPLLHYVRHGKQERRAIKAVGEWRRAAGGYDANRPTRPILPTTPAVAGPKIAVSIHAYYPDVFDALCPQLKSLPGHFTLLISTPTAEVKQAVEAAISAHGLNAAADVRVTPNRGRNFGPMLSEFGKIILGHDLLLHLHTKKSLHGGREQTAWRDDIVGGLIGGDGVTDAVLNLFADRKTVGVVFTRTFREMTYWANHWLQNTGQAVALFARLGVSDYNLRGYIDYPVGGMFWARVEAIRPLFEAGLTYEDFPAEAGQLDGTIAHAIERSFVDLARSRGFTFAEADRDDNLFRLGWSDKNLERYALNTLPRLKAEIDAAKIVSFDLFDTVLLRPSLSPDAVQRYAGHLLASLFPQAPDFFPARKAAEHAARAAKDWAGDVGLDEIYAQFAPGFPPAALARARALELEVEQRLTLGRAPVIEALAYATASGKRVIAISDTYFGRAEIDALLAAAGIPDAFDAIYLSSELGARKDRGDVWPLVLQQEGVAARDWLHLGDNEVSDMQRAGDRGLRVFHTMNPVTLLTQKRFLSAVTVKAADEAHGWTDALLLGPAAARLGGDPFPVDGALGVYRVASAHDLGYCAYGPALFAFTAWLAKQPQLMKLDRLYFLSREGWALQPLYDAVRAALGEAGLPPSSYFYVSRRAVLLARQATRFDPSVVVDGPEFNGDLGGLLKARLGVDLPPGAEATPLRLPADARAATQAVEVLRARIEAQAAPEAAALRAYLAQQGVSGDSGVVDVGYRATIQNGLQKVAGHGLAGFYFGTFTEAAAVETAQADGSAGSALGYFGDRVDPRGHEPIVELAILFEAFLTAPQGQLDRFAADASGAVEPQFLPSSRTDEDVETLAQLHAGALAYTQDMLRWYGPQVVDLEFNPAVALEPLVAFSDGRLLAPASVLKALRVDDAFCGYGEHEIGMSLAETSV